MLMLLGVRLYLLYFGCRNISGENTTDAHTLLMHLEHDLGGTLSTEGKEPLQYPYYEIHGRIVVI